MSLSLLKKDIRNQLFIHILKRRKIWCRNGDVVSIATPCEELKCKYKEGKNNIVDGCNNCRQFQITNNENDWCKAKHIEINDFTNQ